MRVQSTILALGLAAIVLLPEASQAELVTRAYTFAYSGFAAHVHGAPDLSPKPPIDHWAGSFSITFDPSASSAAGSVVSFSSNLDSDPWFGPFAFVYDFGALMVGTDCGSLGCAVRSGLGSAALTENSAAYSLPNGILFFGSGSLKPVSQVNAVPEPSTWALLLFGFAALGAMKFGRRVRASLFGGRLSASSS